MAFHFNQRIKALEINIFFIELSILGDQLGLLKALLQEENFFLCFYLRPILELKKRVCVEALLVETSRFQNFHKNP